MLKKLLFSFLFIISSVGLNAEESKIDSLRTLADTAKADTIKAGALDYLVWEYMFKDADKAMDLAYEQMAAAKKSNDPMFVSKAFFNLGTVHLVNNLLEESIPIFKQGIKEADKANSYKRKFQIYNNLGLVFKRLALPDSAIECYKRSVMEFKKLDKLEIEIADAYNNIGQVFVDKGQLDSATFYLNLGLDIHHQLNNQDLKTADLLNNVGIIYKDQGRYPNALDYYLKARKIYDARKDTSNKYGYILNNIGEIYNEQNDLNKALTFFTQSAEVIGKVGTDLKNYCKVMNNVGQIFIKKKQLDTALVLLNEIKVLQESSVIEAEGLAQTYSNIGQIYELKEDYKLASENYQKSLELAEREEIKTIQVEALLDLGRLKTATGSPAEGKKLCTKSLEIAKELKLLKAMMNSCQCLYETSEKLGNLSQTYQYYKLYREYMDSLMNQENIKEITQKSMQYDFDRMQYQDSLMRAEEERRKALIQREKDIRQEAEIHKQRAYTIAGGVGFVLMLGLAFVLFRGYKNKQKANEIITEQKNAVESQKEIIEEKNREIVDSISYAQRIQNAILPSDNFINSVLPEAFVYFNPKDIVSGDFYWVDEKDDVTYFAAVDCTGHGVPGALVSVVGYNGLNRVLHEFNLTDPGLMLDKLSELVEKTFSKSTASIKDGMDLALCKWDRKNNILEYAGANNPLYLVRQKDQLNDELRSNRIFESEDSDKVLVEIKPDKQPIGKYDFRAPFNSHKVDLLKGDAIYVFSDGYADQFGGEKGKKFMYKPFKRLLTSLSTLKMPEQKTKIAEAFDDWKGSMEQIDDVCVFGVKV